MATSRAYGYPEEEPNQPIQQPRPRIKAASCRIIVAYGGQFDLGRILQCLNYRISGAAIDVTSNGRELVDKVREGEYSLILTSGHLDELNGFDAIAQIRDFNLVTPIYTIGHVGMQEKAYQSGANGHIVKANLQWHLGEIVESILG